MTLSGLCNEVTCILKPNSNLDFFTISGNVYLRNSAGTFKAFKMACEILNVQVKKIKKSKF